MGVLILNNANGALAINIDRLANGALAIANNRVDFIIGGLSNAEFEDLGGGFYLIDAIDNLFEYLYQNDGIWISYYNSNNVLTTQYTTITSKISSFEVVVSLPIVPNTNNTIFVSGVNPLITSEIIIENIYYASNNIDTSQYTSSKNIYHLSKNKALSNSVNSNIANVEKAVPLSYPIDRIDVDRYIAYSEGLNYVYSGVHIHNVITVSLGMSYSDYTNIFGGLYYINSFNRFDLFLINKEQIKNGLSGGGTINRKVIYRFKPNLSSNAELSNIIFERVHIFSNDFGYSNGGNPLIHSCTVNTFNLNLDVPLASTIVFTLKDLALIPTTEYNLYLVMGLDTEGFSQTDYVPNSINNIDFFKYSIGVINPTQGLFPLNNNFATFNVTAVNIGNDRQFTVNFTLNNSYNIGDKVFVYYVLEKFGGTEKYIESNILGKKEKTESTAVKYDLLNNPSITSNNGLYNDISKTVSLNYGLSDVVTFTYKPITYGISQVDNLNIRLLEVRGIVLISSGGTEYKLYEYKIPINPNNYNYNNRVPIIDESVKLFSSGDGINEFSGHLRIYTIPISQEIKISVSPIQRVEKWDKIVPLPSGLYSLTEPNNGFNADFSRYQTSIGVNYLRVELVYETLDSNLVQTIFTKQNQTKISYNNTITRVLPTANNYNTLTNYIEFLDASLINVINSGTDGVPLGISVITNYFSNFTIREVRVYYEGVNGINSSNISFINKQAVISDNNKIEQIVSTLFKVNIDKQNRDYFLHCYVNVFDNNTNQELCIYRKILIKKQSIEVNNLPFIGKDCCYSIDVYSNPNHLNNIPIINNFETNPNVFIEVTDNNGVTNYDATDDIDWVLSDEGGVVQFGLLNLNTLANNFTYLPNGTICFKINNVTYKLHNYYNNNGLVIRVPIEEGFKLGDTVLYKVGTKINEFVFTFNNAYIKSVEFNNENEIIKFTSSNFVYEYDKKIGLKLNIAIELGSILFIEWFKYLSVQNYCDIYDLNINSTFFGKVSKCTMPIDIKNSTYYNNLVCDFDISVTEKDYISKVR